MAASSVKVSHHREVIDYIWNQRWVPYLTKAIVDKAKLPMYHDIYLVECWRGASKLKSRSVNIPDISRNMVFGRRRQIDFKFQFDESTFSEGESSAEEWTTGPHHRISC